MSTEVYTDGACSGNPGPGGWAWAVPGGAFASGVENPSTNQRMEIMAAAEAVRSNPGELVVVSDSTYVVNCFRDGWWEGWRKRGWLNSAKKPVKNRDLWEPFIDDVVGRGDVTFQWVKGHSGDPMNDLVDALAVEAVANSAGRSGDAPPSVVGPADDNGGPRSASATKLASASAAAGAGSGAASKRDQRLPSARLLAVLGHRPPELGGYASEVLSAVGARLTEIVAAKRQMDRSLTVVSGLRLGAEMLGAEAALAAGAGLVAVLPFPDPDAKWPAASRRRFAELVEAAEVAITLEAKPPQSPQKAGASMARRDAWITKNVDEAVLVWNGDPQLKRVNQSLERELGDDLWILDPTELT